MARIKFENGQTVNFDGNPTQADIEEVAKSLGIGTTPQTQVEKPPLLDRILNSGLVKGIQKYIPGAKLGEAIGTSAAAIQSQLRGDRPEATASIDASMPKPLEVGADIANAMLTAGSPLVGGGQSVLGRIGANTAIGAATAGTRSVAQGNDLPQVVKDTAFGGALGLATSGASELLGAGIKQANKLLSRTSNTPEEALNIITSKPEAYAQIGKVDPQQALKDTQGVVKGLRKSLSSQWDNGLESISEGFSGKRLGVSGKLEDKLLTVSKEFGVELPQNIKNASAKEWIATLKSINELPGLTLTVSPKGAIVRELKGELKDLVISEFGGANGSVAALYKNYSTQKSVLDAADDIVKAYKTGKPITQTTALNRLNNVFDENRPGYLQAIKDLEASTGKDILSTLAATKFGKILPNTSQTVRGITMSDDLWTKAIKILLLPLTSPRGAAWLAKIASVANKVRPGVTSALSSGASEVATPQVPPQQSGIQSSPDISTLSPEVQRLLKLSQ